MVHYWWCYYDIEAVLSIILKMDSHQQQVISLTQEDIGQAGDYEMLHFIQSFIQLLSFLDM